MNREYMDEKLLDAIREMADAQTEEARKQAVEDEIAGQDIAGGKAIIYGKSVFFAPREFLHGRLQMTVPQDWTELSPEMAKIKYPNENRPPLILSDNTTSINLTVNHTTTLLTPEELMPFVNTMKMFADKMLKVQFLEEGFLEKEEPGLSVRWYDFISPGMDEALYNFAVCGSWEKRALLITFNCLAKQRERWKPIFLDMVHTLTIKPVKQTNNREGGRYYAF